MAEYVKDTMLLGEYRDLVLLRLVEMTVSAERSNKQLFPSLMEEPVFYRKHFLPWVRDALEERERMSEAQRESLLDIS